MSQQLFSTNYVGKPKIHTGFAQNSLEWLVARAGVVTASEFGALVTPKWKIRTGEGVETYLHKKVAERWIAGPLPGYRSIDMEFGHILEEEAKPWYEWEYKTKIQNVAFITDDSGQIGCSPDGLLGEDGGIEIKCPEPHTHAGYLLAGELPDQYVAQVHGAMYVTGRKWWKFVSYRRNFPALVLTVERNETVQEILAEAIGDFLVRLNDAMNRLEEINGGPPVRSAVQPAAVEEEYCDLIP